ncbi:DNA-directed RNA polymerase subunit A' [Candidatus Nanohalovita haloferacivicina]|uniref:DNA-directed RNA polymerase subunit A' n=1 Tax=Candidatus Nanohalovita haloferacivicina TaxID=2978046 RepID=UPI00325FAE92|nr:DNA-directed RNA polymerase subunit A' [Candidatus Nanohalobia archaeon BNXNv]
MKDIESIDFGIMSAEKLQKLAVKEIDQAEVYDADGYPVEDGVMDPALGVIDPGMTCQTCGGKIRECKGHFGLITLSKPVAHVMYAKQIRNLLRFTHVNENGNVTCLAKDLDKNLRKSNRMKEDPETGEEVPEVDLDKPYSYKIDGEEIKPDEIRERLSKIPDDIAADLGMEGARPEDLILTHVPVPPVTMRPSITLETGERSEDDITHKMVDVIRINKRLQNNIEIEAPDFIIDDLWELLQYHVATMFYNDMSSVPPARHRSGRSLKSVMERVQGKQGRFRQNLIGKRVNFSARTVISPDPNIGINEVGVPFLVAKKLSIPEKVTERNWEQVKEWMENGPDTHPGANYVYQPDGSRRRITDENLEDLLEAIEPGEGWKVERHLKDGDTVLFNRQPSLHRMSIMAHEVKVLPHRTFRLNLNVCAPYNADFDGDEMNLHVPQTEEARAEAEELMKVQEHIKSPKMGGPIVGMLQDYVSGLYLLTQPDRTLSREKAFNLLAEANEYEKELPDQEEISGREIVSIFIPDDISLTINEDDDNTVIIEDGELVEGVLDEDALGDYGGEIIQQLSIEYGSDKVAEFLNRVSRVGAIFLTKRGFSIGLDDLEVPDETTNKIRNLVEETVEDTEEIIKEYERGEMESITGKTIEETREIRVTKTLNEVFTDIGDLVRDEIDDDSSAYIMADSGARGSLQNVTTMAGLLGQNSVRDQRINRGYKDRTTSHFKKGELSPKSRGFVGSSILGGLDEVEMFFHQMSQRKALMDKSLRTKTSGYMYRRVSNSLQDLTVEEDQSVRNAQGDIVQFRAGEDGVDPQKSDRGLISTDIETR